MTGLRLFADLCGTELWNVERFKAYMGHGITPAGASYRGLGCPSLVDLVPAFTDAPAITGGYQLPELDPAPWYDARLPESKNFAGVLVTSADLGQVLERDLVQNAGPGGVITYPRLKGRTIDCQATLIARTCCANTYGLRWFTQAMLSGGADACDDCDLSFVTCCPSEAGDECLVANGVPYYRPSPDDEWARGTDFVRTLTGVGVLQAPVVVGMKGRSCGCGGAPIMQIEFTLASQLPWISALPYAVLEDLSIAGCDEACVEFVKCTAEESAASGCPTGAPCGDDPFCDEAAVSAPTLPNPRRSCGCVPLDPLGTWMELPELSTWFPQALKVELSAGSEDMRNVVVRLFENPQQLVCDEANFYDCEAAGTLVVSYVPAGATFTFDSSSRRATMDCDGVVSRADNSLTTVDGLPFDWLETAPGPACLLFDVDCDHIAEDATASVYVVRREL